MSYCLNLIEYKSFSELLNKKKKIVLLYQLLVFYCHGANYLKFGALQTLLTIIS